LALRRKRRRAQGLDAGSGDGPPRPQTAEEGTGLFGRIVPSWAEERT
jgi:hypothetical protein